MKRQRLTREQSKDQTRQRLLDAAQAIFMKKGFVAASVEDIAAAAGYTRGAFYSNFRSKPELFLELLRRDHESMQADLQNIFEENATREDMEASVLRYYSRMPSETVFATNSMMFSARFGIHSSGCAPNGADSNSCTKPPAPLILKL